MNNRIVYSQFQMFQRRGFSVLRFNFRGVGRSQGWFDHGQGELRDAASALDWMQSHNPNSSGCWVAGFSFGAWIAMQLLMRRPEIQGFICASLPANMYDFGFLAPCPSSGLIVHGEQDMVTPTEAVVKLVNKLSQQRGITIDFHTIENCEHHFAGHMEEFEQVCEAYLDKRLKPASEHLALAR
jgi:alpha/beta superfamily hydrolase